MFARSSNDVVIYQYRSRTPARVCTGQEALRLAEMYCHRHKLQTDEQQLHSLAAHQQEHFHFHNSLRGLIVNICCRCSFLPDNVFDLLISSRASFLIWRTLLQKSSRELWTPVKADIRKEAKMVVCSFFQQGRCKFGGRVSLFALNLSFLTS